MALRSVLEVEVDPTGQFAKFAAEYKRWQDLAGKSQSMFAAAAVETEKQVKSFRELVELAKQRTLHARATAEVERAAHEELFGDEERAQARLEQADKARAVREKRAVEQAREQAKSWAAMAKNVKSFTADIGTATISLLRWGSLTGVIGGIVGAGGLFGIDRLAASVGNQRRVGLGLGVSAGQQNSFGVNFGRVLQSPDALLSGVNDALHDPRKSIPFGALGLNYTAEQKKGTFQASIDVMQALKRFVDKTPEGLIGPQFDARQLGGFGVSVQDLLALKHTSGKDFDDSIERSKSDVARLDLTQDQQKAWQDLQVQLFRAGKQIENTFIVGLKPLATPLGKLSDSVVHAIDAFSHSDRVQTFIGKVGDGLETFARDIDKPDFLKSVSAIGDRFGEFAGRLKDDLPGIESFMDSIAKLGTFLSGDKNAPWNDPKVPIKPDVEDNHPTAFGRWLYDNFDRLRSLDNLFGRNAGAAEAPGAVYDPAAWRPGSGWGGGIMPANFTSYSSPPPQWGNGIRPNGSNFIGGMPPAAFNVPQGVSQTVSQNFAATRAYDFFRSQGWSEAQTAGLLANINAESGFNPKAYNPNDPNGGGQGIAQWNGARAAAFQALFGHSVRQGTLLEQLMFMQYELTHGEKAAGDALRAVGTAGSAATVVNRDYERSADRTGKRETTADYYAHLYSKPPAQVTIQNATGGNAVVTASQLAAA